MKSRNAFSGKILSAVLLAATLLFGGSIIVAIANSLSKDNPLHFWLPPVFMFSWFIVLLIYLSCGKRDEEQDSLNETKLDKSEEDSQNISVDAITAKSIVEKNSKYLIICVIVCFLVFVILTLSVFIAGGTAFWGKIESGRFYLGEGGDYTEVSRLGYILSAITSFILGVSLPFAAYAVCSMDWKTENAKKPSKRLGLFFVVFASFIGGSLAIKSLVCCILAILTVN